jgi:hypothetical protein
MKINEAGWDRVVRVALGIVLLALGWGGVMSGGWGLAFRIMGFLPLLTGLSGFCPAYALLRINTRKA